MPYRQVVNMSESLSKSDAQSLIRELDLLRAELNDIRTKYGALLAKLDADAGVTDTNYAAGATTILAAAQFTPT